MKKIYTPQEIAQVLDVAPATIYAELKRGKLPHRRVGRKYIITRKHLEDYLSSEVVRELVDEEQVGTNMPIDRAEKAWLDVVSEDMAKGIAATEKDTPKAELEQWLNEMEAAVKPMESSDNG